MFALVQNGLISQVYEILPTFIELSDHTVFIPVDTTPEMLGLYGILPVVEENAIFNPASQTRSNDPVITILSDRVVYTYILTDVPLAAQQETVWKQIMQKRDFLKLNGGYQASGKWFHSDTFSRTQQLGLVLLGTNIPSNLQWKTMDSTFITMTQQLAQEVFQSAAASDTNIFMIAETHRQNMLTYPNPTTYDFSGNWPVTYLG